MSDKSLSTTTLTLILNEVRERGEKISNFKYPKKVKKKSLHKKSFFHVCFYKIVRVYFWMELMNEKDSFVQFVIDFLIK